MWEVLVIVLIVCLVCGKLLMTFSDNIISVFVDEHVVCEDRLSLISYHTGFENCMGCLNIFITVINPDNDCVVCVFHDVCFLSADYMAIKIHSKM